MNARLPGPVLSELSCFHCAAPVPPANQWQARIAGVERAMCCPGCAAIATAIEASGMGAYYLARSSPAPARRALPPDLAQLAVPEQVDARVEGRVAAALFDDAGFQSSFVVRVDARDTGIPAPSQREAHLLLQGLHCGACAWLIEGRLGRLPGVTSVRVNAGAARMVLRWKPEQLALSRVLEALRAIGYDASPWDLQRMAAAGEARSRGELAELVVAGLGMMQVMMYTLPVYLAAPGEITTAQLRLMQWASLALTMPVLLYAARSFFVSAWQAARQRLLTMDQPIALGLLAASGGSVHAMLRGTGPVWFDSIAMLVFLLLAARWLERSVRRRALVLTAQHTRPAPLQAQRIDPATGLTEDCSVQQLVPGDCIRVEPGAVLPADGHVVQGCGPVEEALLTGEHAPVWRQPGDRVLAASTNLSQRLDVQVDAVGPGTVLARMMRQMDQALASRAPLATLADRAARHFVAGLLLLCVLVALYWSWRDPAQVLPVLVAMLVVSCPCALALAVPATLAASTARLGRNGMLVLQGHTLETLAQTRTIVFDKTGTLTQGRPSVQADWQGVSAQRQAVLAGHVLALESGQAHPLAQALSRFVAAAEAGSVRSDMQVTRSALGQGVEGICDGVRWRLGQPGYVAALRRPDAEPTVPIVPVPVPVPDADAGALAVGLRPADAAEPTAATPAPTTPAPGNSDSDSNSNGNGNGSVAWLGTADGLHASFVFQDALRPDAQSVVARLQQLQIRVCLFSGDHSASVQAVAAQLGIADAHGGLTPQQKHDAVRALQDAPGVGPVVMVGDGLNDGPGFAAANLSIGMGHLAEALARGTDAVIPAASLAVLAQAVSEARGALRRMRQNLAWATVYNLVAIPLAAAGWLTPWQAGLGMSVSSLLVVLNATRGGRA